MRLSNFLVKDVQPAIMKAMKSPDINLHYVVPPFLFYTAVRELVLAYRFSMRLGRLHVKEEEFPERCKRVLDQERPPNSKGLGPENLASQLKSIFSEARYNVYMGDPGVEVLRQKFLIEFMRRELDRTSRLNLYKTRPEDLEGLIDGEGEPEKNLLDQIKRNSRTTGSNLHPQHEPRFLNLRDSKDTDWSTMTRGEAQAVRDLCLLNSLVWFQVCRASGKAIRDFAPFSQTDHSDKRQPSKETYIEWKLWESAAEYLLQSANDNLLYAIEAALLRENTVFRKPDPRDYVYVPPRTPIVPVVNEYLPSTGGNEGLFY